jgi:beta-aspartyl-peptidase (threonine type)
LVVVISGIVLPGTTLRAQEATAPRLIEHVLEQQVQAWNRGDLRGFMEAYWKSDELTFASGGNLRKGWQVVFDQFQKKYGDGEDLGELTFADLRVTMLGTEHALALGNWRLVTDQATVEGNFSLVLSKVGDDWRIVHDHTSLRQPREEEPRSDESRIW